MLGNSRRVRPGVGEAKKTKSTNVGVHSKTHLGVAGKRQADTGLDPTQKRRAAFGDITNALTDKENIKVALKKSKLPQAGCQSKVKVTQVPKPTGTMRQKKTKPAAPAKASVSGTEISSDESMLSVVMGSQDSSSSGSSQESVVPSPDLSCQGVEDLIPLDDDTETKQAAIDNVDQENMGDPVQVALYAFDIFEYYKQRELDFRVKPYMGCQNQLTASMRAILVDWLVEVQENFELNHETLYLAVKLVDLYCANKTTPKEQLQLVGAVSLFIASKFDERCPPLVEDFLYICDDAYKRKEFLDAERLVLHVIGFDIGMPLSYRFLRRYAKCGRADMETLTLARYILEMSLMEYDFIPRRESEMASASLWLALHMKKAGTWSPTLVHYTGYEESELKVVARKLNHYITSPPKQLTTIRSKYSHKVFYEVAKIPPLPDSEFV